MLDRLMYVDKAELLRNTLFGFELTHADFKMLSLQLGLSTWKLFKNKRIYKVKTLKRVLN